MVKVVPRLVEQRAAPAANDWSGVAFTRLSRAKERPIGTAIPVTATETHRRKFAFMAANDVESPP
jgi:hypothetical protein